MWQEKGNIYGQKHDGKAECQVSKKVEKGNAIYVYEPLKNHENKN